MEEETPPRSPREITSDERERIIREAQTLKQLFDSFEEEFQNLEREYFYVVSAHWLRSWKRYTSYERVTSNQDPDSEWFGQVFPGIINQDIIQNDASFIKYINEDDYRNVFLTEQLQERKDYELVTEAAWEYLAKNYENLPVRRYAYSNSLGQRSIEVALKKVRLIFSPLFMQLN